jgi:type III secretion system (T3SS) SseB-like protein
MHEWSPATEAEAAMRDALVSADQDLYFRILARSELLLPVSGEALAGRAPMGWGTWTTANRTHILAFTSPNALHLCLNEPTGSFRAVPFHALAAEWPNYEWWLAIDPGLPIEAYLPSWFVSQLTRGEVLLPGRTMGARARMAQSDLAAAIGSRARAGSSRTVPLTPPPADPSMFTGRGRTTQRPVPSRVAAGSAAAASAFSAGAAAASAFSAGAAAASAAAAAAAAANAAAAAAAAQAAARAEVGGGPVPVRLVSSENGRPGVETVDAEIVDLPPMGDYRTVSGSARVQTSPASGYTAGGYGSYSGPGYGSTGYRDGGDPGRGYDAPTTGYDAPTTGYDAPTTGYDAPTAGYESTRSEGGFFKVPERDLGARLRERFGDRLRSTPDQHYGGATVGSGDATLDGEPTVVFAEERPPSPGSAAPRAGDIEDAEIVADGWAVGFVPANETESNLLAAAEENNTDAFLSTLLLARIILPVPISMPPGSRPRDKYFPWQVERGEDGQRFVAVFTSPERMSEHAHDHFGPDISSMSMRFIELIAAWPSENTAFSINPGSPVGATLPGSQIVALAAWAADVGLRDEPSADVVVAAKKNESVPSMGVAGAPTAGAASAIVMQRTVPPAQLPFYLERGYDRVSGFVNRASEVSHLNTPRSLYRALGLLYTDSPFTEDDGDVHVLRWVAHRADLYRLPYGGQHEAGMRAMQGWVIERAPFRGNGFAPGDTDVVAEFKVDSVRLPHGAQMWRLTKDGDETMVASFDADNGKWVSTP